MMESVNLKKVSIICRSIIILAVVIIAVFLVKPPFVIFGQWHKIYKTDSTELDLKSSCLTQYDIKKLRHFKNIESLYLEGNSLYSLDFLEKMPHIKDLAIGTGCYNVNDPPVEVDFSPLYKVNLKRFKGVALHLNGFDEIPALVQMSELKEAEFGLMRLPNEMMNDISMLYQIHTLSLSGSNVEDYNSLNSLTQLKYLDLSRTNIQDDDTDFIKSLVELESIDISETAISDFEFLYSLEKLKEVKASEGQLGSDDLLELKNRGIDVIIY